MMSLDVEAMIAEGYVFYDKASTVHAYDLSTEQLDLLEQVASRIRVINFMKKLSPLQVCNCEDGTDLFAIPCSVSFVNFARMPEKERATYLYVLDDEEDLSEEAIQELIAEGLYDGPIKHTLVYAFNFEAREGEVIPSCFRFEPDLFEHPEKLRLAILAEVKAIEGKGTASTNAIRIYRVLAMYRQLKDEGFLSKESVERWLYPDVVSHRMFARDIAIIREIEDGNLYYDRKSKSYRLLKGVQSKR
jgi:hypothetical protein